MSYGVVRTVITTIGAIVATLVAVIIPIVFCVLNYLHLAESADVEAAFQAHLLETLTAQRGRQFGPDEISLVVGAVDVTAEETGIIVTAADGQVLLNVGPNANTLSAWSSRPVFYNHKVVAQVVVVKPVRQLVWNGLFLSLLGCTVGGICFLGITKLPLEALEQASRRLGEHRTRLLQKNAHLDAALSNMTQGLCLFDAEKRVIVANDRYAEIYGLSKESLNPGTELRQILEERVRKGVLRDGLSGSEFVERGVASFREHVAEIVSLSDGRHISVVRRPLADGGLISTHEDITERKLADERIAHLATHDTLTGLSNRVLFRTRLEGVLSGCAHGSKVAVHCLDLDRFKAVNDTLGHPIGDELLRAVAVRLLSCVRGSDVVARVGGDEFAILQNDVADPADAALLASKIVDVLAQPFDIKGHRIVVGGSVGVAVAPSDGATCDEILKNADLALYSSKTDGRSRYRFFEAEMDERIQARRTLELDLSNALALQQFELYYQPLMDLKSGEVVAMEALLRWNHPVRGQVSPTVFIPITEEIGLIDQLGSWVLKAACEEAAKWPSNVSVSVNLSSHQFKHGNLAFDVAAALAASKLAPNRLELEITESVLMLNTENTLVTLKRIRDLGVRIAMDDFGTGYSSLSYLHSFPFDKIKIDKSFVQNLADKSEAAHIFKAIVNLGTSLHMVTTAEGVETEEQLIHLREEGCSQVQGYLFSKPRPAAEVPHLIESLSGRLVAA